MSAIELILKYALVNYLRCFQFILVCTTESFLILFNWSCGFLAKVTTGVSRRVRSAYSTLDSLNFRLGQALRRRPAARLLIVIYMMMLHLWVFFVLFTYSPETHNWGRYWSVVGCCFVCDMNDSDTLNTAVTLNFKIVLLYGTIPLCYITLYIFSDFINLHIFI